MKFIFYIILCIIQISCDARHFIGNEIFWIFYPYGQDNFKLNIFLATIQVFNRLLALTKDRLFWYRNTT